MGTDFLTSNVQASAALSSVLVFVFGGFLFGLLLTLSVTLWLWHSQRALVAKQSVHPNYRLTPGYSVLRGKVKLLEGTKVAVRVRIWQNGHELKTKNGYSHVWSEEQRKIECNPFYLVRSSREQVRVVPDNNVFLVDTLDKIAHEGSRRRVVSAELSEGETVVANGQLARESDSHGGPTSYRSVHGEGWVLRPPRGDRMLLSAEPLEERYQRRAALFRVWSFLVLGAAVIANTLFYGNYHLSNLFGDVVNANVERTDTWVSTSRNSRTTHYKVVASYQGAAGEQRVDDEISRAAYFELAFRDPEVGPAKIPFRVVSFLPSAAQVGTRPTLHIANILLGALLNVAVALGLLIHSARSLPWYDRRKVTHSGKGRLSEAREEL